MDDQGGYMFGRKLAILAAGVGFGVAATAGSAAAQVPLSVEVRADAAIPVGGDFAEHASTGVGLGVSATLQLVPNYGLYGSYSRTTYDLDVGNDARAIASGFSVGLTRAFPIDRELVPWVGTGLVLHNLDLEGTNATGGDSQLGWEVGGGLAIGILPRVRLTPGVGYRQFSSRFLHGDRERIGSLTAGIGLNVAF
jgi:hypothetical protein